MSLSYKRGKVIRFHVDSETDKNLIASYEAYLLVVDETHPNELKSKK